MTARASSWTSPRAAGARGLAPGLAFAPGLALALGLALAGCPGDAPEAPAAAPEAPAAAPSAEPTATPNATPVAPISQAEAEALVQGWLAAQNGADFAAYQDLYAERFTGIKRAGPRTTKFARDGWLADRKRFFRPDVQVAIEGLQVAAGRSAATVHFVQTWSSATYKDVGPKQLVLVRQDGQPRVAREEMLASRILGASTNGPPSPEQLAAVVSAGGESFVILQAETDIPFSSTPRLLSRDGLAATWQPAPDGVEPGWQGKAMRVYGAGAPCDAVVDEVGLLTRFQAHFGQLQYWNGEWDEPAPSAAGVAAEIVSQGSHVAMLAARLDGDCAGSWASSPDLGSLTALPGQALAADEQARVASELRALTGSKALQTDFEGEGDWFAFEGAELHTRAFTDGEGTRYVTAAAEAGFGCGGFYGRFWALWKVDGTKWKNLSDSVDPGGHVVLTHAFDLGDRIVFAGDGALVAPAGDRHRVVLDVTPPSFDCPC